MAVSTEYPRDVEVLHLGRWVPGQLWWAYRTPEGQWRGIVHYFDMATLLGYYGPRMEREIRRRPAAAEVACECEPDLCGASPQPAEP